MIDVKRLKKDDVAELKEAAKLLWENVECDSVLERFLSNTYNYIYIAKENKEIAGLAFAYRLDTFYSEPMLYFHAIDVVSSYRKCGIGKKIMKSMFAECKKDGIEESFLITQKSNIGAVSLYNSINGIICNDDDVVFDFKLENF